MKSLLASRASRLSIAGLALAAALLSGCATNSASSDGKATVVAPAPASCTAGFNKLAGLSGKWRHIPAKGDTTPPSEHVFAVSSNGSVVREIMFPGAKHEMTNTYHLDGPALVVTHYCAAGNQPTMKCTSPSDKSIAFKLDSVSNLTDANAEYMGDLEVVFVSPTRIKQVWQNYKAGQPGDKVVFELEKVQ